MSRAAWREMEDALKRRIEGEVRFDRGSRALYSTDASNYRQVPIGVVVPRTLGDVEQTAAVARDFDVPLLSRGAGTSLAGQCCNAAIVMDWSKYLGRVLDIDAKARRARVLPGTVLDDLRNAASEHGLTFGPDPATHDHCTLGGMIGNNSCGVHSVMSGRTEDNVEELEILTYDGCRMRVGSTREDELDRIARGGDRRAEIYRELRRLRDDFAERIRHAFPDIPRRVSGFNLPQLLPENGFHLARALVGSESTCVTVLEATVRLVADPPARTLAVLGFPDVFDAGDHIPDIMEFGPIGLEGIDDNLASFMKEKHLHEQYLGLLPDGRGWLLVEFGGDSKEAADHQAERMVASLKKHDRIHARIYDDPKKESLIWEIRESGLGATARVPGMRDTWPGWEDAAVPPDRIGDYLRAFRRLLDEHGYACSLYGHFGQGCVHTRIDFDLLTAAGIARYRRFIEKAADLVVRFGGSLSGEHGDGQSRAEFLGRMYGEELLEAFRRFKGIWDPRNRMNPGKVVDPYPIDANLRLGTTHQPWEPELKFSFSNDRNSLAYAAQRCVGVGKCRRHGGGTMCPSYMVTREEQHSTRGRARLLFEMMRGDVLTDGWREEAVHNALDLCLACKGCKADCPVNVDMATYKAEFLSHYYRRRLRPRSAYGMGLIMWWAAIASKAPHLANAMTQTPGLSRLAKWLGGVAPQRTLPRFATKSFRRLFRELPGERGGAGRVILWPDTFNNHFHPGTALAAVRVLRRAGFEVALPGRRLCCGRPLYDYGMLDLARKFLLGILDDLRDEIRAGTPVVGLEPSCVATFRDEMTGLLPRNQDAERLRQQTYLLSEFLEKFASGLELPRLDKKALVHGHCHHKAVLAFDDEEAVLRRLGLDFRVLDSGCCGMAGAFGFEKEHYAVSIGCSERVLAPAIREAARETLILADGFSCRTQIEQCTGRQALHLAEVLEMAYAEEGGSG